MHYDVIVIGAGPAGLMAAGEVAQTGKKVLLLEKNKSAGKKLLISGSGQCNFTHDGDMSDFENRYGDHYKFLKKAFSVFTNKQTMDFFKRYGVGFEIRENKKVFPNTRKSQTILDALLTHCRKNQVTIMYESQVIEMSNCDNLFKVTTATHTTYLSQAVVVATGGCTYPVTGTTGDGYELAKMLGHTVVNPTPALTYVTTHEKDFAVLSGIAFPNASMKAFRQNTDKPLFERSGSLLFTHKGLSGPLILDSTRWIQAGDYLEVNFLNPQTFDSVKREFAEEITLRGKNQLITYLTKEKGLIKSFASLICTLASIDETIVCARLTKVQREELVRLLTKCRFNLSGLGGLHTAMVTAGGVSLKQVNPTTMESRKQPGLYFVGEVLDVDGDTGGYNIQAAFSMGYLCAQHIQKVSLSK